MGVLTLDAGPLIAVERHPRHARALAKRLVDADLDVIVSAATVAEVWRGGPRGARIARALSGIEVEPVDEAIARRAGELLAQTGSSSTIDAIVVATAEARDAPLLTGDLDDVGPLASAAGVDVRAF